MPHGHGSASSLRAPHIRGGVSLRRCPGRSSGAPFVEWLVVLEWLSFFFFGGGASLMVAEKGVLEGTDSGKWVWFLLWRALRFWLLERTTTIWFRGEPEPEINLFGAHCFHAYPFGYVSKLVSWFWWVKIGRKVLLVAKTNPF